MAGGRIDAHWHTSCAEALADSRFLFARARVAAAMLKKLANERARQSDRLEQLLATIDGGAERSTLQDWSAGFCRIPGTGDENTSLERNGSAESREDREAEGTSGKAFNQDLAAMDV